jgi:hypothetical protein
MILWFVMGVQSADKLELAPRTQTLRLRWHNPADLNRRYKLIMDARGGVFPVTEAPEELEPSSFINFEFFVSLNHSPRAELRSRLFHAGVLDPDQVETRKNAPTRSHFIIVQGFSGLIWIRVSKIKGALKYHTVVLNSHEFPDQPST